MGFVGDEQVDRGGLHRREHLRPLDEVDRGDHHWMHAPWIDAGAEGWERERHGGLVQDEGRNAEAVAEFRDPNVAESGGAQDQRAFGESPSAQLREDQRGLDGLAQANRIGEEDAGGAAQHRERGFELVAEQIEGGVGSGPQAERRPGVSCRAERAAKNGAPPAPCWPGGRDDHAIEGRQGAEDPSCVLRALAFKC